MFFTVYVIQNQSGKIYIGQTINLLNRLARHNGELPSKSRSFTKLNKGPWTLVYSEKHNSRKSAMERERELKSSRGRQFIKDLLQNK